MYRGITYPAILVCLTLAAAGLFRGSPARSGELQLRVIDHDTKQPIAVRMHLKNQSGGAIHPAGLPVWKDHFVFDGTINLQLPAGQYSFEMERGPEYRLRRGQFTMDANSSSERQVEMERFADMKSKGWWSGELHIHRRLDDIQLLMRAEDLHIGPVITWWNNRNLWSDRRLPDPLLHRLDGNRFYHAMAGEDERQGGALLYFNLTEPLPIAGSSREYPSPMQFLRLARTFDNVHIDIEKPFWWDMPVWVASRQVDSIGLCNNHMWRDGMLDREAWGKSRDLDQYPSPLGNGQWTVDIYYRLLNCGLRLPPSAGSASGVLNNPVGYNRVYVHCGEDLSWDAWWDGLRAGRVVVTNGPLLRPAVNNELPGHVFQSGEGETVELDISIDLALRDPVEHLEIVKNGQVVHQVSLEQWQSQQGKLPKLTFRESGWMLVRAVTNNRNTYRFGSTGPYYVEIGQRPRTSKSAAQFFVNWVNERIEQLQLDDPQEQESVLNYQLQALAFWQDLVARANAP